MHSPYVADWFYTKWNAVTGMATAFAGGLDYGRKSGSTTGNYARFVVTEEKIVHISDKNKTAVYRVVLESYLRNPSTAELKTASNLLDSGLVAALETSGGATVAGGAGEPTGTVNHVWRVAPPAGDGTLQTEEERRAGGDVQCLKWACLLRVQWA